MKNRKQVLIKSSLAVVSLAAMCFLAYELNIYYVAKEYPPDTASRYQKEAAAGNADAQNSLGVLYLNGTGVNKDYAQALSWFQKSAAAGNAMAQNTLGWMYMNGVGVDKDYALALSWFQKSAAAKNAVAQNNLGFLYLNGVGVDKDYAQALSWFRKSAAAKNALAENNLGWMYQNGAGVDKDYAQALSWFQKSAAAGNELAENSLGLMYLNGAGVDKDYGQALSWFQKSATAGNAMAENNLGSMYRNGFGVTQSYQVARVWYKKAADAGYAPAEDNLRELAVLENAHETLSPEQAAAVASQLTGAGGSYAGAGTRGPATPRTGDGPSYADTISFIEEKLNGAGNAAYTLFRHNKSTGVDARVKYSTRASRVAGDSEICHLGFHYKAVFKANPQAVQDTVTADTDLGFDFRDVSEIRVFSREVDSNSRFPGYTARYDPEIFVLGVVTRDNVLRYLFDFRDEDLAGRVGKALWHAVELCGGPS